MIFPRTSRDRSRSRNRGLRSGLLVVFLVLLLIVGVYVGRRVFAPPVTTAFAPFLHAGTAVRTTLGSIGDYFTSRTKLEAENARLEGLLVEQNALLLSYKGLVDENKTLHAMLSRDDSRGSIAAAIISRPALSPFDTMLVDAGKNVGVAQGDVVTAGEVVALGEVAAVYDSRSLVRLYSSPGQGVGVLIGTSTERIEATARGLGGGTFEVELPKGVVVSAGDPVVLPGLTERLFGIVGDVRSEASDAFVRVLFRSPVNINTLRLVQILKE